MRIDKFLSERTPCSRKEIHEMIKKGMVKKNGESISSPSLHITLEDSICLNEDYIPFEKYRYFILHKPKGYVSSHIEEGGHPSVFDLLPSIPKKDYSIAGRLDQDSTGLVLITNDGMLIHRIKSPKHHLDKYYLVKVDKRLSNEEMNLFQSGISIQKDRTTLPAQISYIGENQGSYAYEVILREGKFHQIKRMFRYFNSEVKDLHRTQVGNLKLPIELTLGGYQELSSKERDELKALVNL